jgi:hypothetical protein
MMTRFRRSVAGALVAALVGVAATPVASHARSAHIGYRVGEHAAHEAGEDIAIGIGITAGALAAVGGLVWYYLKHRRSAAPAPSAGAIPPAETPAR